MFTYLSREWHWFDYSVILLRLLWYIINLIIIVSASNTGLDPIWLFTFFTLSYLVPQFFHIPNRTSSFGFILSELILTGSLFIWLSNFTLYVVDLMWIPILSVAFLSTKKTQWLGLLGLTILPLCIVFIHTFTFDLIIPYVVALVLFGTMGSAFRFLLQKNEDQKLLLAELQFKNQKLIQLSSEIEYLTLKEERNRIAQEIHDAIGHTFTTTIVGIDAISRLIDQQPAAAKEQAKMLSSFARDGLEKVRKYVHALPLDEEISIDFALRKVITSFSQTTGTAVTIDLIGRETMFLPKQYTMFFIHCLQEALTNALKHGCATVISAALQQDANDMILTIKDNGKGNEHLSLGFGLTTMKKRITEFGGTFQIESCETGTTLELKLPMGGVNGV